MTSLVWFNSYISIARIFKLNVKVQCQLSWFVSFKGSFVSNLTRPGSLILTPNKRFVNLIQFMKNNIFYNLFKHTLFIKGAFTNPPGPVRFTSPAACRKISRPCGALPNFISTASMVTYPTEPGQCPVDIYNWKSQGALQQAARVPPGRRPGAAGVHTGSVRWRSASLGTRSAPCR